VTLFSSV